MGKHFSEAHRMLWKLKEERGWGNNELGRELGARQGEGSKLLFGDIKEPRSEILEKAQELGIPLRAWRQEPTEEFVLPANREDDEAEASSDDAA